MEDIKKEISLTQQTLTVASTMIDSIDWHRDQANAAAEKLETTVSSGFEAVVREIGKQGDRATESTVEFGNRMSTGLTAVVKEVGKQGREVIASSQRISAELTAVVDEVGKQGRDVVASSQRIEDICTKTFQESRHEIQALRVSIEESLQNYFQNSQALQEFLGKEGDLEKGIRSNGWKKRVINSMIRLEDIPGNGEVISHNGQDAHFRLGLKAAQNEKGYKQSTNVQLRFFHHIWLFRTFWNISGTNRKAGWSISLTYHHVVPSDSPLFDRIRHGDIPALQQLFSERRASPHDQMVGGISPCDEALKGLTLASSEKAEEKAFQMFRFLIQQGGFMHISVKTMTNFLVSNLKRWMASDTTHADCLRCILENSEDDPLHQTGACSFIMKRNENEPFFKSLASEEYWPIAWGEVPFDKEARIFGETDRMLLSDPNGSSMKLEVQSGRHYVSVVPDLIVCNPCMVADTPPILSLLMQAVRFRHDNISSACSHRISTLLRLKQNTNNLCGLFGSCFRVHREDQISATRYARGQNLTDLWREALENARWTRFEVNDLFDEELYAGIAELSSEAFLYMSRDDCRRDFVRKLCVGGFVGWEIEHVKRESKVLRLNLGVLSSFSVFTTIRSATSAFHQRFTPGGWLYPENWRLVPGIDFVLPEESIDRAPIDWSEYMEVNNPASDPETEETTTEDWYDASEN